MINLDAATIKEINSPAVTTFYLYQIDYSTSDPPLRWTSWDEPVIYGGYSWTPQVVRHSDIATNSDGSISPISLTVGNIDSERIIQQIIEQYKLVGKKVTITQILFGGKHIITFEYRIVGARASKGHVTFTLSVGFDAFNIRIPGRRVLSMFCPWQFGGPECAYSPAAGETCEKSWQACKEKDNALNFGGFPGVTNTFVIL